MRNYFDKEKVKRVIDRNGDRSVPLLFHKWWGQGLSEKYGDQLIDLEKNYPDDFHVSFYTDPGETESPNDNPEYRWGYKDDYSSAERHSIGEQAVLLPDWNDYQYFIDQLPDPNEPGNFDIVKASVQQAGDRYKLGCWWRFLHERFWSIRGMENLMLDYYDEFDKLYLLGENLIEFYKPIVDQFAALGFDGIFVSDDLGHQGGPMMSPEIFKNLYAPLYKRMADYIHQKDMHFFLHSCGDNTKLLPSLIESGVDVIHPIQKGCMDYSDIASAFSDDITFMIGVDVQNLLPNGSKEDIETEIESIKQIFGRKNGGLLLSAGNGILSDTPLENIDQMLRVMTKVSTS